MIINFPSDSYTAFQYPGGEWQVRFTDPKGVRDATSITVQARLRNGDDIVKLALLAGAVRMINVKTYLNLFLPYLPYARADRRFVEGDCEGLYTFGWLLNAIDFDSVTTLDAHNKKAALLAVKRLRNLHPDSYISQSIKSFAGADEPLTLLYPDEGAAKRYLSGVPTRGGIVTAYATKKRNAATGLFEGFEVPTDINTKKVLIVDDICDGGGTFIGIAKLLEKQAKDFELGLYVTHGIFSRGFDELREHFLQIYTTNSFQELQPTDNLTVFEVFKNE